MLLYMVLPSGFTYASAKLETAIEELAVGEHDIRGGCSEPLLTSRLRKLRIFPKKCVRSTRGCLNNLLTGVPARKTRIREQSKVFTTCVAKQRVSWHRNSSRFISMQQRFIIVEIDNQKPKAPSTP